MENENLRSVIVLCGGNSSRMGEDKGSMIIHEKPMILYILETLNNQIDEAILVLNNSERKDKYKNIIQNNFSKDFKNELSYDLVFIEDELKGKGPLSGVMTGLENISSNYALVLPCDSPFITYKFINFIFSCLERKIATSSHKKFSKTSREEDLNFIDVIVPYHFKNKEIIDDPTFKNKNSYFFNYESEKIKKFLWNNSEPLHSIYGKNNSKIIRKLLNSNVNNVKSLFNHVNTYFILVNDDNSFKNINSKEDI